jgi:hypothetical protein
MKIEVQSAVREAVELAAKGLEEEFKHSSFGVDLGAVLVLRQIKAMMPKEVQPWLTKPSAGGKLPSAKWSTLLQIAKVCSNAAAINGALRGYGSAKKSAVVNSTLDDVD